MWIMFSFYGTNFWFFFAGFILISLCACDFLLLDLRIFIKFMLAGLDLSHRFSARVRSHVLLQSPPVLVLVDLSVDSFSSSLASTGSHAEWDGRDFSLSRATALDSSVSRSSVSGVALRFHFLQPPPVIILSRDQALKIDSIPHYFLQSQLGFDFPKPQ
jgi:hypothetical protein